MNSSSSSMPHEPQLISYGVFINEEAARMTVVAVHPDSASLEFHMEIGGSGFPQGKRWRFGVEKRWKIP